MKALSILKKNKLLAFVLVLYGVVLIVSPQLAKQAFSNSLYYLFEMLQVMPVVFLLTAVIDALIPKAWIMRGFGEHAGLKGNLLALLLGSISAGPIYAAFPISKGLLKKGASVTNIVIILSSWAVIKLPMLANESKFLGVKFMAVRWVLTVLAIFIMAYLMGAWLKKKDLPQDVSSDLDLEIVSASCIGCALCVENMPERYAMKEGKAIVCAGDIREEEIEQIRETVDLCPTQAIRFSDEHTPEA